jgi:hypothetical protein
MPYLYYIGYFGMTGEAGSLKTYENPAHVWKSSGEEAGLHPLFLRV